MKKFIPFLALAFISSNSFAQTNFSGDWKLKEKEHVTGPEYSNGMSTQLKVEQTTDSIRIESVYAGADGKETISRQSLALNGKTVTNTNATSKRKFTRGLAWSADKKTLTFTTVFYIPENENEVDFTRVETWSLQDGQLKINKKSIETRSETWEVNAVFKK